MAKIFYRSAAQKGFANAQYALGFLHETGQGAPLNQKEAASWFQKAALQGHALSQYDLGQRYYLGVGVSKDLIQAYKWLTLAAKQGQPDARRKLPEVEATMNREQLLEGMRAVADFRPSPPSADPRPAGNSAP